MVELKTTTKGHLTLWLADNPRTKLLFKHKTATKMFDIKAWAEYVVEWAAKDPYGFLTTVILALTPLFLASAVLSWKLAKMIEAREKEQKKKQKRQENIAKAKRLKKDWRNEQALQLEENRLENYAALEGPLRFLFWTLWQYYLVNEAWAYGRIMLVLTCTIATFRLWCGSLLTVIVNWHLCYKVFSHLSFCSLSTKMKTSCG